MTVTRAEGRVVMDTVDDALVEDVRVIGLNWSGAANADVLLLDDQDDTTIFNAVANTGQLEINAYFGAQGIPATTLNLTTIGGGELVVYLK